VTRAVFVDDPGWILFLAVGVITVIGLGYSVVKEAKLELPSEEQVARVFPLLLRRSLLLSVFLSLIISGWMWLPANSTSLVWSGGEVLLVAVLGAIVSAFVWVPSDFLLVRYLKRKARGVKA
jgi:uncharacterized membrane protein